MQGAAAKLIACDRCVCHRNVVRECHLASEHNGKSTQHSLALSRQGLGVI
jgi:hypothetical protein